MGTIRRTVLEACVLGVVGVVIAVAVNAVRASASSSTSVKWSRNYFNKGERPATATTADAPAAVPSSTSTSVPERGGATTSATTEASATPAHPSHPYQEMKFADVVTIFKNPDTAAGVNVFVDARDAGAYEGGHIPGALHADHYRPDDYTEGFLARVQSADKVIVYCSGGNCEDSIFLCADLMELEIPYDRLYLYTGGWEEWKKNGMPVEEGGR